MQKIVFVNGAYYHNDEPHISSFDRSVHFGDACYETVFYYKKAFLLHKHLERLRANLKIVDIDPPPFSAIEPIVDHLMRSNAPSGVGYTFICVSAGLLKKRSLLCRSQKSSLIIQGFPYPYYHKDFERAHFVQENRWPTPNLKCTSLMANIMAANSVPKGHMAIYYDKKGYITEGTHCNIFIITKQGVLVTPLSNSKILSGCTRYAVLHIAKKAGITYEERPIHKKELLEAEELLFSSSIAHVATTRYLENTTYSTKNPIIEALRTQYTNMVLDQKL